MTEALNGFWEFIKACKGISIWIAGAAVVSPLAMFFIGVVPPWPSSYISSFYAALVECFVLLGAYEFGQKSQVSIRQLRYYLVFCMIFTIFFLGAYLWFFTSFVEALSSGHKVVIGYEYQPHINDFVAEYGYSSRELLEIFHYPEKIWTPESIRNLQMVVLIVWLLFWLALCGVCASFVAIQYRRYRSSTKSD